MIANEMYPGDDGCGEYHFSIDDWIVFQKQLVSIDVIMGILSRKYKMSLIKNIRGEWPGRSLRERKFIKVIDIRIALNPDYLQDNKIFYELSKVEFINLGGLYNKFLSREKIAEYSVDEINNINLMTDSIKKLMKSRTSIRN